MLFQSRISVNRDRILRADPDAIRSDLGGCSDDLRKPCNYGNVEADCVPELQNITKNCNQL